MLKTAGRSGPRKGYELGTSRTVPKKYRLRTSSLVLVLLIATILSVGQPTFALTENDTTTQEKESNNRQPDEVPKPILTLNDKLSDRTVAGTISVTNASFVIKIDDILREAVTVQVGEKTGDVYPWSFVLPNDITIGEAHHLRVEVSKDEVSADPKIMVFQIDPVPDGSQEVAPIKEDPILKKMSANLMQPFPKPQAFTTVFLPPSQEQQTEILTPSPPLAKLVKGQPLIDHHGATVTPMVASEEGWRIWGILWYWWVVVGGVAAVLWQVVRMVKRRLQRRIQTAFLPQNDAQ